MDDIVIFLLLIKCLLYGITDTESCIIYYYRACIIIVHITASFILSLTRSLSDDLSLRAQVGDSGFRSP